MQVWLIHDSDYTEKKIMGLIMYKLIRFKEHFRYKYFLFWNLRNSGIKRPIENVGLSVDQKVLVYKQPSKTWQV